MADVFESEPPTLAEIQQMAQNAGYFQLLDLQIAKAQNGVAEARIQVDARLLHPQQLVHGGVIFTLADTAMAMALMSALPARTLVSTIEAKINYLRPARTGELVAEATIIHQGNTTAVLEATVYNSDSSNGTERLPIAKMLGTFNIQRKKRV
jgi:acyl-CoA thioesterase